MGDRRNGALGKRSLLGTFYDELFAPTGKFFQAYNPEERAIVGFAAPTGGQKPCAVELVVGAETIAFSKAGRFSQAAYSAELRYGWCGFQLSGLSEAIALEGVVAVRCAVSGEVLHQFNREEVETLRGVEAGSLSAMGLLRELRLSNGTTNLKHVLPFLNRYASTHGARDVVEVLYRYLLRRSADESGMQTWACRIEGGTPAWQIAEAIWDIAQHEKPLVSPVLEGPFEPGFAFGRQLFDLSK